MTPAQRELPEWPGDDPRVLPEREGSRTADWRARSDYWSSRLRVAVEALEQVVRYGNATYASEALALIGELPPEETSRE